MDKNDIASWGLAAPGLEWNEDSIPYSNAFNDVYFSRQGGPAETRHTFLGGNDLESRWQALHGKPPSVFVIGETGFGSGLNFLCAMELWDRVAPKGWHLHFVSTEIAPLDRSDLARAHAAWPELAIPAQHLQAVYPQPTPGFHRRQLHQGRVTLSLLYGDATRLLSQLCARVDAWFLDGFSPANNPELWSDALIQQVARLSAPGTSCATYTVASRVRNGLEAQGFELSRRPGFGQKREMLTASLPGVTPSHPSRPTSAMVIGGGLAGTSCARKLAERGIHVTLLEAGPDLASGASGNPFAVLYAKLSPYATKHARFQLGAYLYALHYLNELYRSAGRSEALHARSCGVLQTGDAEQTRKWRLLSEACKLPASVAGIVEDTVASELAGIPIEQAALWFPDGCHVDPGEVCRLAASHANIEVRCQTPVTSLERNNGQWLARSPDQSEAGRAEICVIAGAAASRNFAQAEALPFRTMGGQVSRLPADGDSKLLRSVLCGEGFLLPVENGQHGTGSTYDRHRTTCEIRTEDHLENISRMRGLSPALDNMLQAATQNPDELDGSAGIRAVMPDYLPSAGSLEADPQTDTEGLYISAGHGSRGVAWSPLCAERIAAEVCAEPMPLEQDLLEALEPARFTRRKKKSSRRRKAR